MGIWLMEECLKRLDKRQEDPSGTLASLIPKPLNHLPSTSIHSALSKLSEVEKLVVLLWHTTINSSST